MYSLMKTLNIYSQIYLFAICVRTVLSTVWLYSVQYAVVYMSIYKFGLSVCLFVCLFVSNKRQNGWTDRAQFFVGPSVTSKKVYGWSNFQNLPLTKFDFWKFGKFPKFCFYKIREVFVCFWFTMYTKTKCSPLK